MIYLIIVAEIIFLHFAYRKGEEGLRIFVISNVILVLSVSRKVFSFFGLAVNINIVFYGTIFLIKFLIYKKFGLHTVKQTVYGTLYSLLVIFTLIILAAAIPPMADTVAVTQPPISLLRALVIAKIIAVIFILFYFTQVVFLLIVKKTIVRFKDKSYLIANAGVQLIQFPLLIVLTTQKHQILNNLIFQIPLCGIYYLVIRLFYRSKEAISSSK
jgi:hypothetical protein